jgi:hypothetical protein
VADLSDGWADQPPLQWMVQSYLGIKSSRRATEMPSEAACTDFLATMAAKARP